MRRVCQYRGQSTTAFNSVPVAGPAPPLEVPRHRLLPWEPAHFPTLLMGNVKRMSPGMGNSSHPNHLTKTVSGKSDAWTLGCYRNPFNMYLRLSMTHPQGLASLRFLIEIGVNVAAKQNMLQTCCSCSRLFCTVVDSLDMTIHIKKHKFEWTPRSICTQARSLTLNTSKIIENCYESKTLLALTWKIGSCLSKKNTPKCHRSQQNSWKKTICSPLKFKRMVPLLWHDLCTSLVFHMTRRPAPAIVPWRPWSPAKPLSSAWLLWPDVLGVCSKVGRLFFIPTASWSMYSQLKLGQPSLSSLFPIDGKCSMTWNTAMTWDLPSHHMFSQKMWFFCSDSHGSFGALKRGVSLSCLHTFTNRGKSAARWKFGFGQQK